MIYGYTRVSTNEQNADSQKNIISRYGMDNKLVIGKKLKKTTT